MLEQQLQPVQQLTTDKGDEVRRLLGQLILHYKSTWQSCRCKEKQSSSLRPRERPTRKSIAQTATADKEAVKAAAAERAVAQAAARAAAQAAGQTGRRGGRGRGRGRGKDATAAAPDTEHQLVHNKQQLELQHEANMAAALRECCCCCCCDLSTSMLYADCMCIV